MNADKFASAEELGVAICKMLGLDPGHVTKISLTVDAGELTCQVTADMVLPKAILDIVERGQPIVTLAPAQPEAEKP